MRFDQRVTPPDQHALPSFITRAPLSRRALLRLGVAGPVIGAIAGVLGRERQGVILGAASTPAPTGAVSASPAAGCPASPFPALGASPAASPTAPVVVRMTQRLTFDPPELTIRVGQVVHWVNDSPLPHTATGDPEQNPVNTTHPEYVKLPEGAEPWGSELLQPGEEYEHTFTVPGRYDYICVPHVLSGMRATITVEC